MIFRSRWYIDTLSDLVQQHIFTCMYFVQQHFLSYKLPCEQHLYYIFHYRIHIPSPQDYPYKASKLEVQSPLQFHHLYTLWHYLLYNCLNIIRLYQHLQVECPHKGSLFSFLQHDISQNIHFVHLLCHRPIYLYDTHQIHICICQPTKLLNIQEKSPHPKACIFILFQNQML